jgi:transcriptional regulator with XRE-family HTH domain
MINHDQYVAEREESDPAFREARDKLRPMFEYRRALIGARLAAGLSQKELAARLGTTQSAIARLESGTRLPSVETLYKLAQVLGLDFTIAPSEPLAVHRHHDREAVASGV